MSDELQNGKIKNSNSKVGINSAKATMSFGSNPTIGNSLWPNCINPILTILPKNQPNIKAKIFLNTVFIFFNSFILSTAHFSVIKLSFFYELFWF